MLDGDEEEYKCNHKCKVPFSVFLIESFFQWWHPQKYNVIVNGFYLCNRLLYNVNLNRSRCKVCSTAIGDMSVKAVLSATSKCSLHVRNIEYRCNLLIRIDNSEATPKGGFWDVGRLMDQTDSGPVEFQWIVQPLVTDALSSRVLSAWLTYISVRLVQSENVQFPIFVTLSGIVILSRTVQPENADFPISVTLFGIVTLVRLVQPANA